MNDHDPHNDHLGVLVRIARTLDVPVATFLTAGSAEAVDIETAVEGLDHPAEEGALLLRLFVRLKSPAARARCLAYVAREATRDG